MAETPEQKMTRWLGEYRAVIYRVVMLYARDAASQEDLFQDIATALWRSLSSFKGHAKESTWIYRVALNTAIDHWRSQARKPRSEPFADSAHWVNFTEPDEQRARLYAQIRQLAPIERSLLLLHLDGNSYAEIGDILGLGSSAVGVKLNRLKKKLRDMLAATAEESK